MDGEQERGWWATESSTEMYTRTGLPPHDLQDEAKRISRERRQMVAIVETDCDGQYEIRLTGKRLRGRPR